MDLGVDLDRLSRAADVQFGARYGGYWIDRSVQPPAVRVAIVHPTDTDGAALARMSGYSAEVSAAPVDFTQRQLSDAEDSITRILIASNVNPFEVDMSLSQQLLIVRSQVLPESTREQIESMPGSIPVRFDVDPFYQGMTLANSCRSCYPPFEAGLEVDVHNPGDILVQQCTTGFTLKRDSDSQHFGTTAGHCGDAGAHVKIGDSTLPDLDKSTSVGIVDADAARFPISSVNATPKIFVNDNADRFVDAKYGNSSLSEGVNLCFQGRASGADNCGQINAQGLQTNFETGLEIVRHAACTDIPALRGDSGGPVYHVINDPGHADDGQAKAAGIVTSSNNNGHMCFSTIDGLQNAMNAGLAMH